MLIVQAPEGASLEYTKKVGEQAQAIVHATTRRIVRRDGGETYQEY